MSSKDSPPAGSSPNDPNPSLGGNEPSGFSTPEGHSPLQGDQAPSPHQGSTEPTIWHNTEEIKKHPLVHTAVMLAKEGIDFCNLKSYGTLDSQNSQDHKKVLLSLPGKFTVGNVKPEVKEDDETDPFAVFATSRPGVGIVFNEELANVSTNAAKGAWKRKKFNKEMVDDQNILNFIAMFQETIEHELGHMKYHHEGVKDDNGGKTDPEHMVRSPQRIRFEAGFEAQKNIRINNFPKEDIESIRCKVLDKVQIDGHTLDLRFAFFSHRPTKNFLQWDEDSDCEDIIVEFDDLLEHMDYPRACGGKKRKREDGDFFSDPPDDEPSTDRGGDGDGDEDSNPPSFQRNGRSWIESVKEFLPIAMNAFESTIEKKKPQFETSSNWKDPLLRRVVRRQVEGQSFEKCDIKLMTCDKDRKKKTRFHPQDDIYVKLSIHNGSERDVMIMIAPGPFFGRDGLEVEIKGATAGPLVLSYDAFGLKIPPSESYTIFRILTKPDARKRDVGYATPPIGHYTAAVPWFSEYHGRIPTCSFSVVSRRRSPRRSGKSK